MLIIVNFLSLIHDFPKKMSPHFFFQSLNILLISRFFPYIIFVFADPIELEHVFATFLALLYVPAEMSEFPKVDQTTLMDHSTTHTKLVQHPAKILMSAEMTTEDTTEETSEMETIPTADKIPDSMPIGLLSLLGLTDQFSQAGPTGLLEVLLAAPLAVPAAPSMDLSGKVDPDPDNLWMIFLTENHLMIMPLLLLELSK